MKANFHTHTVWCDGENTARELCEAAVAKGMTRLGFSSHSDMVRDFPAYIAEIRSLAREFAPRLRVFCGVEAEGGELPAGTARGDFDYVIGSVHYVTAPDGARVAVDDTPERLRSGLAAHFGGDAPALVRAYFAAVRESLTRDFEVIGHPDLVRKFNVDRPDRGAQVFFDPASSWYRQELEQTANAIAASGKLVEVNTGAIARGWLDDAYPAADFRRRLRELGVRMVLSSDAHSAAGLDCEFERFAAEGAYVSPWGGEL